MFGTIKASLKLLLMFLWTCLCYPPVWLAVAFKKLSWRDAMSRTYNCGLLRIMGIRLTVSGALTEIRPLLLVTNHISYLDIPVLACNYAVRFTPKSEIASWPVINSITRLSGAVFVDRSVEKVVEMRQGLHHALAANQVVCLFPESTTGDGLHLQPFKSAFFSLAGEDIDGRELIVQPACITYTHIRGLPIGSAQWPSIAWYGDMELASHAWELLKLGSIKAELTFLPPVTMQQCGDRKKLAAHCHKLIAETLQATRDRHLHAPALKTTKFHPRFLRIKG